MKSKILLILITTIIFSLLFSCNKGPVNITVLVVTGGHSFDTTEFYDIFRSMESIQFDTATQPAVQDILGTSESDKYDVFVFYDFWQGISEEAKKDLVGLTKKGKGMVFMHHSLGSHQEWNEYEKIIGGKYHLDTHTSDSSKFSNYKHDISLHIKILDKSHPITNEMDDFTILDEGYSNISILPSVHPLLSVDHPDCAEYVGWTNQYNESDIVYLLLGHDNKAYENEEF